MAKAIYEHVFELTPVENQLNAIIRLVRWVHEEKPIPLSRLKDAQGSENTEEYVQVLSDLRFLTLDGKTVAEGRKMQETQLLKLNNDQYVKTVIGNIVKEGYKTAWSYGCCGTTRSFVIRTITMPFSVRIRACI